jgi:SAM-dependent methyltransferase
MSAVLNLNRGNQQQQYTSTFAEHWDDLVGWEARLAREGHFYARLLKAQGCRKVADIATGTGVNAVGLAQAGFEVTATDGSENMLAKARENAAARGIRFADSKVADWLHLDEALGHAQFDAVVCLGNSFTHLFDHEDRRDALRAIHRVLRPSGMLVIDQRNYDRMLDHGYDSKHALCYTGEGVQVGPVELNPRLAKFEYRFDNGSVFQLNMYPLRQHYLTHLLEDASFVNVERFGDLQRPYDPQGVDFVQQVAFKPE